MRLRRGLCLPLLLALGCGSGNKFAPVSGKVTLNGEPLVDAVVGFTPIVPDGTTDPPAPSSAKTNDLGEFTLMATNRSKGAWVGKHKVAISLMAENTDERRGRRGSKPGEQVPSQYNQKSTLEFDVPASGTNQANFELKSP
jgi:hypothetical protein